MRFHAGFTAHVVYHASKGAGSHFIRLNDAYGWANHVSRLYAPPGASPEQLRQSPLYESRSKVGVTGPLEGGLAIPNEEEPGGRWRTLGQAITGGDAVEVYQLHDTTPERQLEEWLFWQGQLGKEYDMPGLVGFVPLTLLRKSALEYQRSRKGKESWWCSEIEFAAAVKWHGVANPPLINTAPFQCSPEKRRTSPYQTFRWGTPDNFQHAVQA